MEDSKRRGPEIEQNPLIGKRVVSYFRDRSLLYVINPPKCAPAENPTIMIFSI